MKTDYQILSALVVMGILMVVVYLPSDAAIPPTRAFFQLFAGDENITATTYNDSFNMSSDGSIILDIVSDNVTMILSNPSPTILGGVHSGVCDFGNNFTMVGITTSGSIQCEALP